MQAQIGVGNHGEKRNALASASVKCMRAIAGIFNAGPSYLGCTPEIVNYIFPPEIDEALRCMDGVPILQEYPALKSTFKIIYRNSVAQGQCYFRLAIC